MRPGFQGPVTSPNISISTLLDFVNRYFPDILPEDVLKHYGRVLDYNAKKRDDLSVIANPAGVGNITESSLITNLARFRKEVNSFREKNHIVALQLM